MTSSDLASRFFAEAMSPAYREDPYALYERFRGARLLRVAETIWFCLGHADVVAMLRHPQLSSNEARATTEIGKHEADVLKRRSMLFMDPPDHTRLRGLVVRAFTPKRIEDLRVRAEAITTGLLDDIAAADGATVNLIDAFAYPLPVRIICALLGIPEADEVRFAEWSRGLARSVDPSALRTPEIDVIIRAAEDGLEGYLTELLDERRRSPRDDLLSALLAVEASGDRITPDEVINMVRLLLVAGHETTVNLIGNGVLALLQAPDQMALLRQRPDLAREAVDELLRYDSPVQITQRVVTQDMVLADTPVRAGDEIMMVLGAANRDPQAFAEPDRLDLTRDAHRHVGFGGGIHHCLGAALARMEGQIAFAALLARFPRVALAGAVARRPTFTLRGLSSLPVRCLS
ncbi:cytochrome P450 [Bradyrhizobium sp. U87765 SZCCT0131]|uniref:cytochrome P450 n=1 Tax=unclassified Bradyrhizobium TaxID=2631580 RepID=UPI001BAD673C|nr:MULTISPECIES: cytochrome P450 [unclassified Bradyrhizobium]MBR1222027.1 cytochrome P450 [Bradyrhizobium sp. U87765 SZCCT0131]MBR1263775.1 cytochrome P450 [Bradyrhizobium sp. U87765 SZCCT0134]MBR1302655.1 cytochrome P450 [Bradyrhizobium sp. U87765 SZCCT0110]MBR1320025.1 cytochrome P450 [Bradyrhizobium sp. U87765 SZCCT0109]MBR1348862.1 cytochrome P450 [Bradyrhizobium sp. U87765 SZCCT0048]